MDVAYSDVRQNRIGMLIHDYVFMANVIQPKVCVMENVPEMAKSDVFLYALERLRRYGYLVSYKKLVATDYGVAQKRNRLFVIAVRPDVADGAGIGSEAELNEVFPRPTSTTLTVSDALEGLEIDQHEREMLLSETRKSASYELVRVLDKSPPLVTRMPNVRADWTFDFSLSRASWHHPCPTITASGAAGRGGVYHPEEDRIFTIKELKRLSGLPDDFRLTGLFPKQAERIGRMVPPLMTAEIAKSIYRNILSAE